MIGFIIKWKVNYIYVIKFHDCNVFLYKTTYSLYYSHVYVPGEYTFSVLSTNGRG